MYDIGIVGAGPAGSTLARLLADRYRVLLLDSGRTKCCGGILAPEAQKMLARLDLALPKTVLVDPQPYAVAVFDTASGLVRHYSRQYVNVDRSAFDRWLLSLVPSHVDIRRNAVYRRSEPVEGDRDSMTVHFTVSGENHTEQVRRLIGADGAASAVRREFFPERSPLKRLKRYVAIQHWFDLETVTGESVEMRPEINFRSDYVGVFDSELTDFYAWTIPKNGRLIVGGALPFGPETSRRFEQWKRKMKSFGWHLSRPEKREAGQLVRPLSIASICLGDERVVLIGEAAGLISPSSAEGISMALASAGALSEAFESGSFRRRTYVAATQRLMWDIRMKIVKCPAMFHPWLRKQIMSTGWTSLKKER